MICVADCERVQAAWYRFQARVLGGREWSADGLTWLDGPDGLSLMFPRAISAAGLAHEVAQARATNRGVGAWLDLDVDPAALADAGFERGWSPCWMSAELAQISGPSDARIELQTDTEDYGGEHADSRRALALTRVEPTRAWYAAAYSGRSRRFRRTGLVLRR